MFFALFIGILMLLVLWDHLHHRRHAKMLNKAGIVGPPTVPFLGNALTLLKESPATVFDLQQRLINQYGRNIRMTILFEKGFMTADPRMIEAILSSQKVIQKNNLYDLLHSWLGTGLLLSTGKKWFRRRKIITPTFHFKILEQFVEVFDQNSAIMAEQLYEKADGKTVINMFPVACLCALDIIAETAMGVQVHAQRKPDFPYVQSVKTASNMLAERFLSPAQRFDTTMKIFYPKLYNTLTKTIQTMHDFTDSVIADRRAALQKSIADGSYDRSESKATDVGEDVGQKRRMALLDVLLQASVDGQPLSNADIREEVDTFMFEGHDTTTSGISYTLYLLSRNPEAQARCFQEIREVIGDDKTRPVDMKDLGQLKYLECAIKESLRLFPPVPLIGRYVAEDTELNGKLIPANTNVILLTYHAQRDPEFFEEPNKFNPDRFAIENKGDIDPFAYTPFSAGPRNCIGQKFAMLEMKSTISKMLRHFELLPLGPEVQPLMNLILRSTTGINVGIKPRVY
ncbi:probable cytochrome P450 4d14 [Drosophila willistoni]|nr:probable cytochrome P450 4d14 [Drosophila willistoni]